MLLSGAAAVLTSLAVAAPSSAQAQVNAPNRTELVPPTLRQTERPTTLTIDGGFQRAPCALDRAEYAEIKLTVQEAKGLAHGQVQ